MDRSSLKSYIHKTVNFQYRGQTLNLALSQQLFSSHDIDAGSKFLLKSIAQQISLNNKDSVLDVGCGVGTLGLSLKAAQPNLSLEMQDRDALACAFTSLNARRNKLEPVHVHHSLMLENLGQKQYDLILSNIPAKAGTALIKNFILGTSQFLKPTGICAVVIVHTLSEFLEDVLRKESEMVFHDKTKMYSVFHFKPKMSAFRTGIHAYIRQENTFTVKNHSYRLQTVYNIGNFDSLSYDYSFFLKNLDQPLGKQILVWNPGQGHIPAALAKTYNVTSLDLGGRDALALLASQHNLQTISCSCKTISAADLFLLSLETDKHYDHIYLPDLEIKTVHELQQAAKGIMSLLAVKGMASLLLSSQHASQLKKIIPAYAVTKEKRHKAYRILSIKKALL